MSDFAFIKDPIRDATFALVVKSGEEAQIYAFSERAQSWANSQFGTDITPPDGMMMSQYKVMTPEIKSIIEEIDCCGNAEYKSDPHILKKIISPNYVHQKRVLFSQKSTISASMPLSEFPKRSRESVIDFKARKFILISKRTDFSIESSGLRDIDDNKVTRFGSGNTRRTIAAEKSHSSNGFSNKRVSRRVKSLMDNYSTDYSINQRISISVLDRMKGFRSQ